MLLLTIDMVFAGGKVTSPLQGLERVAWSRFEGMEVEASDLPTHIKALTSNDAAEREQARRGIESCLIAQGAKSLAAVHVVPFLLEIIEDGLSPDRAPCLHLLRQLAFYDEYEYIFNALTPDLVRAAARHDSPEAGQGRIGAALYDQIMLGVPVFCDVLRNGAVSERAEAAAIVGYFPEQADVVWPHVINALSHERDADVAGTVGISAGFLGLERDAGVLGLLRERLRSDPPASWGAAIGLGWNGAVPLTNLAGVLEECRRSEADGVSRIPFYEGFVWALADEVVNRRREATSPPY